MKRGSGDRFDRRDSYKRQSTGYGSSTCTEVGTNYYPSAWHLHHVEFTKEQNPEKPGRTMVNNFERKKNIERIAEENPEMFNDYIFDGGMLLCKNKIEGDKQKGAKMVKEFVNPGRKEFDRPVIIDIEYVRVLGEDIHCLNQFISLLLKRLIGGLKLTDGKRRYKNDGKNGWFDNSQAIEIGDRQKVKLWPGFKVNLSQFGSHFFLNLTIKHKVLHSTTVLEWLETEGREAIESELPFTIVLTYSNEMHRIDAIDWEHHPTDTFERKEKGEKRDIQYLEYFQEKYSQSIRNLKQPLLISYKYAGNKSKGKKIGELRFIPELCVRTGCTDEMKCDTSLSRQMIQATAKLPKDYNTILSNFVKSIPQDKFKENHISIAEKSTVINPTILDMPTMHYGNKDIPVGRDKADYSRAPRDAHIIDEFVLNDWIIVCSDDKSVDALGSNFHTAGANMGVTVSKPQIYKVRGRNYEDWEDTIRNNIKESTEFVFVILPHKEKEIYRSIKNICLLNGKPSQCVIERNICSKRGLSICTNILLQIASKMGKMLCHVNNIYNNLPSKSMVCSLAKNGSILSFTFSLAQNYNIIGTHSEQLPSKGQLYSFPNFKDIWIKAFNQFVEASGSLPPIVVFYRESLSHGQLESVADNELNDFYLAAKEVGFTSKPHVVYVTYNKTSNARFFNDSNNAPSGCCIDSGVVDNDHYDWYIVAHTCNQGVLTPTYYSIYNKKDVPEDICKRIQKLTFELCFQYNNWLGAIRIPSPAMYAEKASSFFHDVVRKGDLLDLSEKMEQLKLSRKMPYL